MNIESPKDQLTWELGNLAKTWAKKGLDYSQMAEAARVNNLEDEAQVYEYLSTLSVGNSLQAAFEAGQVSSGGKREGIIPTMTLAPGEK